MAKIIMAQGEDYSIATMADNIKLFLAGGITNCADWQAEAIKEVNAFYNRLTVYNPRNPNYDVNDPSMEERQICWEFDKLSKANIIVFWFAKETLCPITLLEYGKYALASTKPIVVGVDPEYKRKNDIIIQTSLARPDLDIYDNFKDFLCGITVTLSNKFNMF